MKKGHLIISLLVAILSFTCFQAQKSCVAIGVEVTESAMNVSCSFGQINYTHQADLITLSIKAFSGIKTNKP